MKVTINNKPCNATEGQTILEVARAHGVYIPTLCYHEKAGAPARCRACVVEVKGRPGLVTSCDTTVSGGMEIVTDSKRVIEAQRFVIKLAISSGNHDCIICEKGGECELQDAAYHLKIEDQDIRNGKHPADFDDSSAFIRLDHTRCILCGRCVEACNHVVVNRAAKVVSRGYHARIGFGLGATMGDSACVQCGQCIQICPVGALTAKKSIGEARFQDIEKVRTTCPYCGVGCQLELKVRDGRIVKVNAVEDAEPNKGRLCVKGRFGYDFIYSEDRLTTPLIK
ncbi:MAG: 2Fe-2S iron-sulfur cluster-binding protein, partial [Deltaproteobacteria bacterium]|nr:2Fe-2S iron-sulfur cluster-binding protein [Deltaproteobacteria bacterium]